GPIGRVFVASRPPGADVVVDGKKMGFKTPHWLEVPSGQRTISLTKGAQKGSKAVQVKPGKNKSVYIILE
ncbi:PEGA domain-containing protein, partial [Fibrobacterota bacterium]